MAGIINNTNSVIYIMTGDRKIMRLDPLGAYGCGDKDGVEDVDGYWIDGKFIKISDSPLGTAPWYAASPAGQGVGADTVDPQQQMGYHSSQPDPSSIYTMTFDYYDVNIPGSPPTGTPRYKPDISA